MCFHFRRRRCVHGSDEASVSAGVFEKRERFFFLSKHYRFAEEGRSHRIIFKSKNKRNAFLAFGLRARWRILFLFPALVFFFFLTCLSLEAAAESNRAQMICVYK